MTTAIKKDKLFHKNFTLVIIGQIISVLGDAIITFALPLHLLKVTGSATVFGAVMAISIIPTILVSPFGGMVADRVNRRNIMVALDFAMAAIIALIGLTVTNQALLSISVGCVLLGVVSSFYQPAVQACIPSITSKDNLLKANSLVNMIGSVAMLVGPIIGGFLYGIFGIVPVVVISAVAFALSAIMEIFIKLPFEKVPMEHNMIATVKKDFSESIHFITKKNPVIAKTMMFLGIINMVLTSLMLIGLPYIMNIKLGFSEELYGIAQSFMGVGGLLGGISMGLIAKKLTDKKINIIILAASVFMIPVVIPLLLEVSTMSAFWIISGSTLLIMACATIISVVAITFIQQLTPSHMTGKIMSLVMTMAMCAMPVGQAIYGYLFENIGETQWIIYGAVIIMIVVTFIFRNTWGEMIKNQENVEQPETEQELVVETINA